MSQTLGLAAARVQTVVDLLDAGNTVPFITRYRKDQTGGMDEEQVRQVQSRVLKLRLLAERKQTILRSIDSQGKLTAELAAEIAAADTARRLEDLYLPYKPKKQTLATIARDRGLEALADEILKASPTCADLDARAADFISVDRKVSTAADALLGAGHILAEWFSERADLRGKLRAIFERSGKLVSTRADGEPKDKPATAEAAAGTAPAASESGAQAAGPREMQLDLFPHVPLAPEAEEVGIVVATEDDTSEAVSQTPPPEDISASNGPATEVAASEISASDLPSGIGSSNGPVADVPLESGVPVAEQVAAEHVLAEHVPLEQAPAEQVPADQAPAGQPAAEQVPAGQVPAAAPTVGALLARKKGKAAKKAAKAARNQKDDDKAFRDYFQYSEAINRAPPHRVLAINRGERAKVLRVRIDADVDAMYRLVDELLIPIDHPHADFLRGCARDALTRLVLPSLEREVRRELTDRAEVHAVEVFARNLRNLLLQPPVRDARVLAVDPGFKSGCKIVAIDEFGNVLDHGVAHIVGSEERRTEGKRKAVEMAQQHQLKVIAVGNGTGCRAAEQWVSDLIAGELAEANVAYVVVNEAGASVYSTSRTGREELPKYDATARGAVSIGRRLQDPLSELVKIDPANIGVGMYQHDIKAKHLRDSLDSVVASCVNFVGVDLNTASPALLRYVSGLNQLTARRVYDYRITNGPFKTREELKSIQGFGEATFVQAAGFLKIADAKNPLDATWIHPESYGVAEQILARLEAKVDDLQDKESSAKLAERLAQIPLEELASQLSVGTLGLRDIVSQLTRPGRDPRESLPQPIFKRGILKIDDLTQGMELAGTVLNVVDFGAFIDIGLKDSGLVHISQLANRYVQ
ncbi:MAG TPA: Tex-like N-terminal domain-containing protein, partial [Pirellulales bacterium]|nr:Tex-like N-terminal domain-containing protein [Pirellulales bacterium]